MRKYKAGRRITSLDDLAKQELIVFDTGNYQKTYHRGWFLSWPIRNVVCLMSGGCIFTAEPIREKSNDDY